MAGSQGGLTASIRRKLQDGKTPEEIVQELVAGGLTEVSAQRFVDRAVAEHASAPPLPEAPPAPQQGDSLDQFIQTKQAEAEVVAEKTGRKTLAVASLLMCGGVAITTFSYMMADPGGRFTLMWGPVVFGALMWGQAVIRGLAQPRTFAWFTALGTAAAPVVLAVLALGFVLATAPSDEELLRMELAELAEEAGEESGARPRTVSNASGASDEPTAMELLVRIENTPSPTVQCRLIGQLADVQDADKEDVINGLMEQLDVVSDAVKVCIASAMTTLDRPTAIAIYESWQQGSNRGLKTKADRAMNDLR
jgi:hypothetical protein